MVEQSEFEREVGVACGLPLQVLVVHGEDVGAGSVRRQIGQQQRVSVVTVSLIGRETLRTRGSVCGAQHEVGNERHVLHEALLLQVVAQTGRPERCPTIVLAKL